MASKEVVTQYISKSGNECPASRSPPHEEQVKNIVEKINKFTQDTVNEQDLNHVVFEACSVALVTSREAKLLKPLIKALHHLEKMSDVSRSVIRDTLMAKYLVCRDDGRQLNLEYLQFWYHLIEGTEVGKEVIGQYLMERYLDATFTISNMVKGQLGYHTNSTKLTGDKSSDNSRLSTENQSLLHACIKFLIQLYQNFRSGVSKRISCRTDGTPDDSMTDAKQLLVSLLNCPTIPKDCVFLAATCLIFHLGCQNDKAATVQEFLDIYSILNILEQNQSEQSHIVCSSDSSYLKQCMLPVSTHSSDLLARIALVNGLLACAEHAHLWQVVSGSDGETHDNRQETINGRDTGSVSMTLFEWLFYEAADLCRCGEWQFHAFGVLQLWYNKATKYAEKHLEYNKDLFGEGCEILKATLDLVWTQMDSPVDGVTECISQVYKMALALHMKTSSQKKHMSTENDYKEISPGVILGEILDKALQMSWHVKSKHAIVSGVMAYVPMSYILKKDPHLGASLLDCMSTNFLAPSATQVFMAALRSADIDDSSLRYEISSWISKGLICADSLRKHNVNHLWLPVCIKLAPQLFHCLLKHTEESITGSDRKDKDSQLYMFTCLLKSARMNRVKLELPVEMLRLVLWHVDDDLRLDGFALTCVTPKKSEPLSEAEISLLQSSLPHSMNNDNAPFRQQIQSHLRTAFVRARDSVLSSLKDTKMKASAMVVRTLEFLDWFWRLCIDNLHPGASYQRLKTSLDWITIILETLTYQPGKHQKKGTTPQKVAKLLEAAMERKLLLLHTDQVVRSLLSCLLHGTDEIRECAGEVLHTYIPWPLPLEEHSRSSSGADVTDAKSTIQEHSVSGEGDSEDAALDITMRSTCNLLMSALDLCDNPKAYESEAGALLVKLVFSRLVVDHGYCFQMTRSDSGKHKVNSVQLSIDDHHSPTLHFITQLVSLLKNSCNVAKDHVIQAATTCPGHGLVVAIQRCLTECRFEFTPKPKWGKCIQDLLDISMDLLHTVMNVLGSSLDGEGVAPSFEQMGLSVQRAIADCAGDDGTFVPGAETILTSQQQLVMTWSWVNTRQISVLLGYLVDRLPLGNQGLLDVSEVRRIAQIFVGVLTGCRHRGAIEGCNVGFMKFCTRLLNCKEEELRQIPGALLKEVLDKVRCAGSDASITRRSAGLPLIVQSIVASEGKTKQCLLLIRAINELLVILADPIPKNQDQRKDLPHVHALNILRAIFREASIAGNAQPYVASTTIHAIDGFASPIWAIQNGAMQLFSTLLQRMLGQKKTKDDHLNTMTLQEFFVHYPALQPYLLQQLTSAVKSLQDNKLHLNPTLCPILTILSKLSAGITQFDALDDIREMVLDLASSAILAVRDLAAAALPALIPKQDLLNYVIHLASQLPEHQEMCHNYNALHGTLLQIDRLMCHVSLEGAGDDQVGVVADLIYSRAWIGSESNACFITRAAYIRLLQTVHQKSGFPFTKELIMILYLELQMTSQEIPSGVCRVGFDQYLRQLVKWRLEMDTETLKAVGNVLRSPNRDLILACLKHIESTLQEGSNELVGSLEDWLTLQNLLFKIVQKKDLPWEPLCETFECLIAISELRGACSQYTMESGNFDALWERMNFLLEKERNSLHAGYAVAVMGILLHGRLSIGRVSTHMKQFCDILLSCSDPVCSEHLRRNCARALVFIGAEMLEFLLRKLQQRPVGKEFWYNSCVLKLTEATESLLLDEDPDIRRTATRFVSSIFDATQSEGSDWSKGITTVIHPNVALERLKSWSRFCDKLALVKFVLHSMKIDETAVEIIMRESKAYVDDLFAPEEVNPYKERAILHALRTQYEGISNNTENKDIVAVIENQSKEIYEELEEASELLRSLCVSALNVTCNKCVFDALWSIIQRCKICLKVSEENENRTLVLSVLHKLREIPLVHPKLKMEISNLCSSYK